MATILIVDDKTENLYLLQSLLQGHGYEVRTAANGREALEVALGARIDLVIADILMPVMDGFTLCREWRADEALRTIPFIFYTATYTDEKDEKFALSLGADLFIVKPAEPTFILNAVRDLLQSTSRRPAAAVHEQDGRESAFLQEYNRVLIHKLEDKLEDLERANAELRALDIMKDNLLRNVSHELRTPLTVIQGYVELIGSARSGPVTEKQIQQCASIRNNLDRLLHMINNLIFLADPDAQDRNRKVVRVALGTLYAAIADAAGSKASEKSITLACPSSATVVEGDHGELLQALYNLVDNAVKFTPKGGRVEITESVVGDAVRIAVRDTGIGIAPEEQMRIFERFYQVDPSTTRRYGGLGLGLAIVREIARKAGGRIELASTPREGSTFTLILPVAAAQPE